MDCTCTWTFQIPSQWVIYICGHTCICTCVPQCTCNSRLLRNQKKLKDVHVITQS